MKFPALKAAFIFSVVLAVTKSFAAENATASADDRANRMEWWREARFGMFVHYGPVSLTGKELSWSRANSNTNCPNHGPTPVEVYDNLYQQFNPTNFNASDWTGTAKMAGMKYMIFVAKHCDGFLMWPSKVDPFNIGASPFKRDFCAELSQAARKDGLGFGFYFSPMDWRDPECRSANNAHFVAHMQNELRELLTNYGKIDVMWFDSDGRPTMWSPETTYPLVRGLQPQMIIDNRLQLDTSEQWAHQEKLKLRENEDFYTPEQKVGSYDDQQPWESCMTLGTQWSWKPDDKIKSAAEVIGILAQTVGGDGNLLLDVGPMPDGRIEPRQVEVLKKVGTWMDVNGESIYGTRGGPWKPMKQIASTRKGNTVYVFVLNRNETAVELPALPENILSANVLGGGSVKLETANERIVLHLEPRQAWTATVVKLQLAGSAMGMPAIKLPAAVQSQSAATEPLKAFCVDFNWGPGGKTDFAPPGLWADADPAKHMAWYDELGVNVIQSFAVSCNGYAWYKGGKIPPQPGLVHDFLPELVKLGHGKNTKVMGYFCIGANSRWGLEKPELNYGAPAAPHIPFTDEYLDYLSTAIEEALTLTGIDGFMIDWVWNPNDKLRKGKWLPAEQKLFVQLMGKSFPGATNLTTADKLNYEQLAIDRCWERIRSTAKRVKPDCVIWLSCNNVRNPSIAGSRLLREVDWVMDESGTPATMRAASPMFDPKTKQLLCVVGWGDKHDARKIVTDTNNEVFSIYGFAKPNADSLPLPVNTYLNSPIDSFKGNDRNIAVLARLFNQKKIEPATLSDSTNLPVVSEVRAKQLQDLRWGMFVCWSFSTFSGKEWTPGVTNIDLFAAKNCDADQWVKTAKDAGMGYILFLAKHHDGFCLWDTQTTDRKVTKAPLGRDVLAELKKSCDKYGIKLAIYFSEGEWAWPGGALGQGWQSGHIGKNPEMKKAQLKELLTRYGPIEYIWFDYAVGDGGLSHAETARWVKQFQPSCFVGFNAGSQVGADIRLGEEGHPAPLSDKAGAGFNSKHMSDANNYRLAEFTYPILPKHKGGANWFYSLPEHDHLCLPAEKIYVDYLGAVKYGNVFSLNVGPDYNGKLRAIDVETLRQVGEMIRSGASGAANE